MVPDTPALAAEIRAAGCAHDTLAELSTADSPAAVYRAVIGLIIDTVGADRDTAAGLAAILADPLWRGILAAREA